MAIIKCKMCGGDVELAVDKTFGTCEFCGNTMTFPKVDDDQRAAAFNRGNHFRRIGEFDKALAVYERIVREDDTDAEAHWCCALCRFGIEYVEDPATYEWMPTCHRASFDSFLEDVDYLAAVEYSEGITKRQYQKDGAKIAEVQRGILATSQNEEPFDVFICYKESDENGNRTRDSLMAQDVYYQLTDQGYRVFFARITLEDMAGKQYEPYIFAALNSAKVMIVIGTQPEYMNAVWVKNEWSRFLTMMKKDRNKILLPCYKDMDPYDMPEQLSVLQSYDMTKIGFIQDLIRGIKKVLDADKKQETVRETVVMQQNSNNNIIALLKRGNMALEDGEWDKADQFFEEVLNQDAECVDAYLGKLMASFHIHQTADLPKSEKYFGKDNNYQKAVRFADAGQAATLRACVEQNQEFLLKSGERAIHEGAWAKASAYYKDVLLHNPQCARAYIGVFLADEKASSLQSLVDDRISHNEQVQWQKLSLDISRDDTKEIVAALEKEKHDAMQTSISRYMLQGYIAESAIRKLYENMELQYRSAIACREKQLAEEEEFWEQNSMVSNALKYATPQEKQEIEEAVGLAISTAKERLEKAISDDEIAKNDVVNVYRSFIEEANNAAKKMYDVAMQQQDRDCGQQYQKACMLLNKANTIEAFRQAKSAFTLIHHYRDSMEKAKECRRREEMLIERKKCKDAMEREISDLLIERAGLGMFAGKRKAEIDARVEEIKREIDLLT